MVSDGDGNRSQGDHACNLKLIFEVEPHAEYLARTHTHTLGMDVNLYKCQLET